MIDTLEWSLRASYAGIIPIRSKVRCSKALSQPQTSGSLANVLYCLPLSGNKVIVVFSQTLVNL